MSWFPLVPRWSRVGGHRTDQACPTATGGSPILKYLPQNLTTVLHVLSDSFALLPTTSGLSPALAEQVEKVRGRAETQLRVLDKELKALQANVVGKDDKRAHVKGSVGCDGVG